VIFEFKFVIAECNQTNGTRISAVHAKAL
jgi:hypothetical protein